MGGCRRQRGVEELVEDTVLPDRGGEQVIAESTDRMEVSIGAHITNEGGHQLTDVGELAFAGVQEFTLTVVAGDVVADRAIRLTDISMNHFDRDS